MLKIVNMIPNTWSDDQNQDCEPNLSVNPSDPRQIIGTAFTFDNPAGTAALSPSMTGNWAPFFYSADGGDNWQLEFVLPSASGNQLPTYDVTSRFAGAGGEVYSGLIAPQLSSSVITITINRAPDAVTQQTNITSFAGDQPFLEAATTVTGGVSHDHLFVGYNANGQQATSDVFPDAKTSAASTSTTLDVRFPADMPPTRTAIHHSGTIYCAFYSYDNAGGASPGSKRNVVVVKDLNWGTSVPPYQALIDGGDGKPGVRLAIGITNPWYNSNFEDPSFGNDRYGPELAIAVDPHDAQRLYIVYATGTTAADEALHVRWSADGGQNWSADVRTVPKAKNPSLAINTLGMVGFAYQQVVGANWATILEVSDNGFVSSFASHTLCSTPTNSPTPATVMATYLGDYIKLQAMGADFYGTFCASNAPSPANFPSGVTYLRNVNWATQTLLGNDGVTPVPVSIDPFFFKLTIGIPRVTTAIPNRGFFGDVCHGGFVDELLTINNSGSGTLKISKIVSTSADFLPPGVLSYPIEVSAGDSIDLIIRFRPTGLGFKSGKIEIFSNDPASPHVVDVSGECPTPRLSLMIANRGSFGKCCVGSFKDEYLTLNNSGTCRVMVTGITSSAADFVVPEVISYPLAIAGGDSLLIPIRFAPAAIGPHAAVIEVDSSDPASPHKIRVSGDAPSGKLAVSGSLCFGGVKACCRAERTLTIYNVGDCDLHVSSVALKRKSRFWKLINNPFPATLHPGSGMGVVIRYKAMEKCAIANELVIASDDPATAVRTLDLMAYTVWEPCGCSSCCDDCKRGCCSKRHDDCCCQGSADDCCEDEDDGG